MTKYTILHKGKIIHENLTEHEYMDIIGQLSENYYLEGSPRPIDLKTIMKED